jgi:hypothetical protein
MRNQTIKTSLLALDDRKVILNYLKNNRQEYVGTMIARSNLISQGKLEVLGNEFSYTCIPDWHYDPNIKHRWPVLYRKQMDDYIWSSGLSPDFILLLELNRHQYLHTLGITYLLTGNNKYVETFVSHISNWIKKNPFNFGLN